MNKWTNLVECNDPYDDIYVGNLGLPSGMDRESFEINTGLLGEAVLRFGNYSQLAIEAKRVEEDSYHTTISNISSSGVGTATNAVARTKAKKYYLEDSGTSIRKNCIDVPYGRLGITINNGSHSSETSLNAQYDPVLRAKFLDGAIKKASIGAVWNHQVKDSMKNRTQENKLMTGSFDVLSLSLLSYFILDGNLENSIGIGIGKMATLALIPRMLPYVPGGYRLNAEKSNSDYFFHSLRPTRAIISSVLLVSNRIVRPAIG